jgi:CMP-N-acetylneuraminic acid synthetase
MKSISVVANARTQSTRVPRKLVRPFAGTTLLDIALAKLDQMQFFEHRYLAVAEAELSAMAGNYPNVEILHREREAVQRGVNPQSVTFAHYLQIPSEYIFAFNPCLPCVSVDTIRKAFDYFQSTEHPSYMAAMPTGDWVFDADGEPVTNADPANLTTNQNRSFRKATHAFYIVNKRRYAELGRMWSFRRNDPHLILMPEDEAIDVDTEIEFSLAEMVWQERSRRAASASLRVSHERH